MREFDSNGLRLAEFQGKIFEASVAVFDCSSPVFLRRFRLSRLLKVLDKNESSLLSLDVDEALADIERQFSQSDYGKDKYSSEAMFWMGYFYRYVSYTRGVETPFLFKLFSYSKLNQLYYVYHTQDMEWCIENLLESQDCTEDIFDRNKRLRRILRDDMKAALKAA